MRVVVITGGTGGIGTAIAEKLVEEDFYVCVTDRDPKEFKEKKNICFVPMDVEKISSVKEAYQKIHTDCGPVYGLVNNAGIFERVDFREIQEEQFLKTLNVNLLGAFRASQIFLPDMIANKGGRIVNIASLSALRGAPKAAPYAASKGGLVALTKTMAVELAPYNIQVNAVLPGYIETPMMTEYKDALKQIAAWKIPTKRVGQAWEVAEVVGDLMKAKSTYLTGTEIVIDGGLSCA